MLYNLLYPLHAQFSGLNVFRYITFRSIGGAVTAFLVVFLLGPMFIRWLKQQQIGQDNDRDTYTGGNGQLLDDADTDKQDRQESDRVRYKRDDTRCQ